MAEGTVSGLGNQSNGNNHHLKKGGTENMVFELLVLVTGQNAFLTVDFNFKKLKVPWLNQRSMTQPSRISGSSG